jgi:hypothetical protein
VADLAPLFQRLRPAPVPIGEFEQLQPAANRFVRLTSMDGPHNAAAPPGILELRRSRKAVTPVEQGPAASCAAIEGD